MADYFDYNKAAREAGLTDEQLETIQQGIRREYPHDDMLYELHVLRACNVIKDGHATYEQVVQTLPGGASAV